jgi:hypothetical protein
MSDDVHEQLLARMDSWDRRCVEALPADVARFFVEKFAKADGEQTQELASAVRNYANFKLGAYQKEFESWRGEKKP